jgi:hypothetical protein
VSDDEEKNALDSSMMVEPLQIDATPTSLLSGELGRLKKVETSYGDTFYPVIITNAGDTTGFKPTKAGNIFINTTGSKIYISQSDLRGGWVLLNFLLPFLILRKRKRK